MKNKYHLFGWLANRFKGFFTRRISIFVFVALLQPKVALYAQNNTSPETESRLKKAAEKYFDKEDFMDAYPLYSQLLSLYPRDPNYNYRFGACLLYTHADKNKAVDYLEFSLQHPPVEDLAYYYLGRALHLNYRFNEAINSYKKFEQAASSSELKKYPVDRFIEMCVNGKKLLANLHGLDVLRKKELNFPDYMEAYDMRANGGTLLSEPEAFKTKPDKEKKEPGFIYLTPDKSEAFFSSYGNNENNGKDIYEVKRNSDGTWGTPENLGSIINTDLDEDYPVYDAPRNTLYFCSKGHNSMGGYDIFRSVYSDTYDTWSEPENLDFPINTPDDDILFIPDTSGKTAFFASTRSSPQNMIDVYKIVLHLHPPQLLVVAGTAYKDDGKTPASCTITVRNIKTNDVVGIYKSSAEDGKYSFSLPNGGSYNFTVEDSTHKTQSQPIVLPVEQTMSAMQQDIKFDSSGTLRIKNYTPAGGIPEDSDYRLAYNYLEQQAQMDVNVDTNSIQTLLAQNTPANPDANTKTEIVSSTNPASVNTDSIRLAQEDQPLNVEATNATDYAGNKMEEARHMEVRAYAILKNQNGNNSGANPDSVSVAKKLLQQSAVLEEKGIEAYRLAAAYKSDAAANQSKITTAANSNSAAITNPTSAGQPLVSNQITTGVTPGNLIREQAEQLKEDSSEVVHTNDSLKAEVNELEQKSQSFITQAGQTNDPQEKLALLQQADDLSKSREVKQEEIKENTGELQQLHDEHTWLNSQAQKADNTATKGDTTNFALKQEINEYANANNPDSASRENNSNNNAANEIAGSNENANSSDKNNLTNTSVHSQHSNNKKNVNPAGNIDNTLALPPANASPIVSSPNVPAPVNTNTAASSQTTKNIDTPIALVPVNTTAVASPQKTNTDTSSAPAPVTNTTVTSSQTTKNIDTPVALVPVNTTTVASPEKPDTDTSSGLPPANNTVVSSRTSTSNVPVPVSSNTAASTQKTNTDTSNTAVSIKNGIALSQTNTSSVPVPVSSSTAVSLQKTNTDTPVVSVPVNNAIDSSPIIKNIDTSNVPVPVNTNIIASSQIKNTPSSNVSYPINTNTTPSSPTTENKGASGVSAPVDTTVAASTQKINTDASNVSSPANHTVVSSQTDNITSTVPAPVNTNATASPQKINTDAPVASAPPKTVDNLSPSSNKPDSVLSKNSENTEPSPVSNIQYTADTASVSLNQESQNYFSTATLLADDAEKTRKEAYNEPDQTKSGILYSKADSLDNVVSELNLKGEETHNEANYHQYRSNLNKVAAISGQLVPKASPDDRPGRGSHQSDRIDAAQKMLASADADYKKSLIESDSANNNTDLAVKRTYIEAAKKDLAAAILQQQSAISLYTKADSEQMAGVPTKLNPENNRTPSTYSAPPKTENETTTDIFREVPTTPYSASNPIPIDPSLPTGIIFKVQVGAFRKPIRQNLFQGIEPVVGLTSPDGLIRYSAGSFSTLPPAKDALGKIRADGYPEAFIVAFYNGKRIAIKEALAKLGATPAMAASESSQANSDEETPIISVPVTIAGNTIVPSRKELIEERKKTQRVIKDTVPPSAQSFKNIKGLVFTVQVGSYSRHKGFIKLRKIKHLYYWTDKNGMVKYNSGTYRSIADAIVARNIIIANTPVKDAFVSAYYNGERITTKQAKDLLNRANTHPK